MDIKYINQIFDETAYVRMGGSQEELKCAEYLKEQCAKLGLDAYLESFEVETNNQGGYKSINDVLFEINDVSALIKPAFWDLSDEPINLKQLLFSSEAVNVK